MRAPLPTRAASAASSSSSCGRRTSLAGEQTLEVLRRAPDVRDVEVGALLEADVDEGGLHAGEHALDPALVDVADDPALALPLDVELAELPALDERDPGLGSVRVDDNQRVGGHTSGGGFRLREQEAQYENSPEKGHRLTQMSGFITKTPRGGFSPLTRNRNQINQTSHHSRRQAHPLLMSGTGSSGRDLFGLGHCSLLPFTPVWKALGRCDLA